MIRKVVIIGTGNVAWHLAHKLPLYGSCVVQIVGRNADKTQALALDIGADYSYDFSEIYPDADFYIYAVSDDSLSSVIESIKVKNGIHIHTSGSADIAVFEGWQEQYGVMYPSQTFTIGKNIDFEKIAIFIEGNNAEISNKIESFAKTLSLKTFNSSSQMRCKVHLANVIASNFANALWAKTYDILKSEGLRFADISLPLIEETLDKLRYMPPQKAQTGPAIRGDNQTINKHLKLLAQDPKFAKTYTQITNIIKQI